MSALGIAFFLATRHPLPTASIREVHLQNLELRADGWIVRGETEGFTGVLIDTYEDGLLKSRSAVFNGLLHGLSQGWHTNGQLQVEEHFVGGTSHGVRTKWHPNGKKLSVVNVADGKLQGTFRSWHENGVLAEEVELTNGQPEGLSKAYFPSGSLKSHVTLRQGKVADQQFYKDGEYPGEPPTAPGSFSVNKN